MDLGRGAACGAVRCPLVLRATVSSVRCSLARCWEGITHGEPCCSPRSGFPKARCRAGITRGEPCPTPRPEDFQDKGLPEAVDEYLPWGRLGVACGSCHGAGRASPVASPAVAHGHDFPTPGAGRASPVVSPAPTKAQGFPRQRATPFRILSGGLAVPVTGVLAPIAWDLCPLPQCPGRMHAPKRATCAHVAIEKGKCALHLIPSGTRCNVAPRPEPCCAGVQGTVDPVVQGTAWKCATVATHVPLRTCKINSRGSSPVIEKNPGSSPLHFASRPEALNAIAPMYPEGNGAIVLAPEPCAPKGMARIS